MLFSGSGSFAIFSGVANFSDTIAHEANNDATTDDIIASLTSFFIFIFGFLVFWFFMCMNLMLVTFSKGDWEII
jgi:hypothetical protein